MAVNLQRRSRYNSDINITPFVDVMLVLLIIFMVSAPLMINGIDVDLPQAQAESLKMNSEPIVISITRGNQLYINDKKVDDLGYLVLKLKAIMAHNSKLPVFVKGDKSAEYGQVLALFSELKRADIVNVSLITEDVTQ